MNNVLKILLISNSVNVIGASLLIPVFALFVNKLTTGIQLVGVLFAIQFISSTIFGLLVMRLRDHKNLDNLLLKISFGLKGIAWLVLAFSQNIPTLIGVQITIGIATAIGGPAFNSLMSENLDANKHIKDWTTWELVFGAATALGSILSGFILSNYGFTYLFAIMAILDFISLAIYSTLKLNKLTT